MMTDLEHLIAQRKGENLNVLFVCASNICRSPYAEFVFRRLIEQSPLLKGRVVVRSAAVFNRSKNLFGRTRTLMLSEGWTEQEIDAHVPAYKKDYPERFAEADIIIGMTSFQKLLSPSREKFITLSEAAVGRYVKIRDPWLATSRNEFDAVMHEIRDYMPHVVTTIERVMG